MKENISEVELVKQIISRLKSNPTCYSGICCAINDIKYNWNYDNAIEDYLPKLYKHLSQRNNNEYYWDMIGEIKIRGVGYRKRKTRIRGTHNQFYWKPFHHPPRIAILKKVYNIK